MADPTVELKRSFRDYTVSINPVGARDSRFQLCFFDRLIKSFDLVVLVRLDLSTAGPLANCFVIICSASAIQELFTGPPHYHHIRQVSIDPEP